jgi:hypothetical protein
VGLGENVAHPVTIAGEHAHAASQGFQHDEGEAFIARGDHEGVEGGIEGTGIEKIRVGAIAREEEVAAGEGGVSGHRLSEEVLLLLSKLDAAHHPEDRNVTGKIKGSPGFLFVLRAKTVSIDPVVDHLDRTSRAARTEHARHFVRDRDEGIGGPEEGRGRKIAESSELGSHLGIGVRGGNVAGDLEAGFARSEE